MSIAEELDPVDGKVIDLVHEEQVKRLKQATCEHVHTKGECIKCGHRCDHFGFDASSRCWECGQFAWECFP